MAVYLVTYDLNKEISRPAITDKIKACGDWAMLSESSYAINVNMTPDQVFQELSPLLDNNDQLFVIPLKRPYSGYGQQEVVDWLNAKLPY